MRALTDLRDEEGSSLTELAIIAPMFILLLFWAQFFTDLGILKLKVDEASRFAVWELVAQRPAADVTADLTTKFKDLASPDQRNSAKPYGTRSFSSVTVTKVQVNDTLPAPFGGRINNPESTSGGLLNRVLRFLNNFLNKAVDTILKAYKFDMNGEAEATVSFRAPNSLFPGGSFLGYVFKEDVIPTINMTAKSPPLLVDTWRAWPGKYSLASKDVNASPYSTYGKGSAPELEVAKRMDNVAFFGLGSYLNGINRAMQYVKLPGLTWSHAWSDKDGPIAMLPGDRAKHGFVPGANGAIQRIGDQTRSNLTLSRSIDSPNRNDTDRYRTTTPSPKVETWWWKSRGGLGGMKNPNFSSNPYQRSYACRDAYYLGSTKSELSRWGKTFSQYASSATPACP